MSPKIKHGMCKSKEYACWRALKNRCTNIKNKQYKDYGGRGITFAENWHKFESFYQDMGPCPEGYEIDRIDNDKNYSKENCRWTTKKINSRNRRSTKKHKIKDDSMVQQELIEKIGWTKDQFRWYKNKYGISWILEGYKNDTLPLKINKSIDKNEIVGKLFGKWLVVKYLSYKRGEGNRYLCRCDCGLEKEVVGYYLRSGKSTGCRSCAAIKHSFGKHARKKGK